MNFNYKSEACHALRIYTRVAVLVCMLTTLSASGADTGNVTQVDWDTRTASCPAKVTQSTNVTIRVTNINDLLIDFENGYTAQYQLRAKGSPMSAVPPENPFVPQSALLTPKSAGKTSSACDETKLRADLVKVEAIKKDTITPPKPGGADISWQTTENAAQSDDDVAQVESDMANTDQACKKFFNDNANHPVVRWINKLNAQPGATSSGAPLHSMDFSVNLEPNTNYEFTLQESWEGKVIDHGTMKWSCGENDIVSLSVGPLITTLPYRSYVQQQVPTATGTQNELVVNGNTPVNVLGAALINIYPPFPKPNWAAGFAFSVGPVYTLGDAPSVSKLGLFVGGSFHLYRSFFLTPGVHIGQFADYPAGFHEGSVIPSGFGSLTPVTRNTAHFAFGITFKTNSFKKSSQNTGAAANTGTPTPKQPGSTNKPTTQPGSTGSGPAPNTTGTVSNTPAQQPNSP